MKKFTYFANHGDEDGNNCFTISYGDGSDIDNIIIGVEDKEKDAKEVCKRLNQIMKDIAINEHLTDIYGIETNLMDVPMGKAEKAAYRCEIKNHKIRISEIKHFMKRSK